MAAPTAGLHFDDQMLADILIIGVHPFKVPLEHRNRFFPFLPGFVQRGLGKVRWFKCRIDRDGPFETCQRLFLFA